MTPRLRCGDLADEGLVYAPGTFRVTFDPRGAVCAPAGRCCAVAPEVTT